MGVVLLNEDLVVERKSASSKSRSEAAKKRPKGSGGGKRYEEAVDRLKHH